MHKLTLKKLPNFDYKANLLGILKNAPAQGYSVDEVRLAVKAIDCLEKAKDEASFEDNVWEFVKEKVNGAKFVMASKELAEFLDDFK